MKTKNFFQLVLLALTVISCTSREDESKYFAVDPDMRFTPTKAEAVYKPENTIMTPEERLDLQAQLNNGNPTPPPGGRIPNNP